MYKILKNNLTTWHCKCTYCKSEFLFTDGELQGGLHLEFVICPVCQRENHRFLDNIHSWNGPDPFEITLAE